jgi:hypothetical protein
MNNRHKYRAWNWKKMTYKLHMNSNWAFWNTDFKKWEVVFYDTVMQSTWCNDKNNVDIYEWDIFDSIYKRDWCKWRYVITWSDRSAQFFPKKIGEHQQNSVTITMYDMQSYEIIWNIYETPQYLIFN